MKKLTFGHVLLSSMCLLLSSNVGSAQLSSPTPLDKMGLAAPPQSDGIEAVRHAEKLREYAMARGDVELLKTLFSEYYYHVESNGRVRSKTQLMLSMQRGEFKFFSYKVDELEVKLSGLAAVTTGRFTVVRDDGPKQRRYSGRFIRLWESDGNRWRNTMHQATEIKPRAVNTTGVASTQ